MEYIKAKIYENNQVARDVCQLILTAPFITAGASPGQFIMLRLAENSKFYLNRPFAIAAADTSKQQITLYYKVAGEGTRYLSRLPAGSMMELISPLGNGFPLPKEEQKNLLLAGGIGIAPLLFLADKLWRQKISADLIIGDKTADSLINLTQIRPCLGNISIYTEDGSLGKKGYPTDDLAMMLQENQYKTVYVCGPTVMMQRAAGITIQKQVKCYVSLEERMGCGFGVCMGCVCKIKAAQSGYSLQRVCKEGPVFSAEEVFWR